MEDSQINPPDDFKSPDDEAFYNDCLKHFKAQELEKRIHSKDWVFEAFSEMAKANEVLLKENLSSIGGNSCAGDLDELAMLGMLIRDIVFNYLTKGLDEYAREHIDMSGYEETAKETYNEE